MNRLQINSKCFQSIINYKKLTFLIHCLDVDSFLQHRLSLVGIYACDPFCLRSEGSDFGSFTFSLFTLRLPITYEMACGYQRLLQRQIRIRAPPLRYDDDDEDDDDDILTLMLSYRLRESVQYWNESNTGFAPDHGTYTSRLIAKD